MLTITIEDQEFYDEQKEEFLIGLKGRTINLEHSLLAMSKWEARHKKIFLESHESFTTEEFLDYVRCMTVTPNVNPELYNFISPFELKRIAEYIGDQQTATVISEPKTRSGGKSGRPLREKVSTELIYYWMVDCGIPFECQKWHISRLLTLIRVCNIKAANAGGGKKMSRQEILRQNAALNASRRAAKRTRG